MQIASKYDAQGRKVCVRCGKLLVNADCRKRYCDDCAKSRKAEWNRVHSDKRYCKRCGRPLWPYQRKYCSFCDPAIEKKPKKEQTLLAGKPLTLDEVLQLCKQYRSPFSTYGKMMAYINTHHALPPKEYRR